MKVRLIKECTPFRGEPIPAGTIVETWVNGGVLEVKGCWLPLKPDEWELVIFDRDLWAMRDTEA